jgi:phytoene dehydrogenase-like protein
MSQTRSSSMADGFDAVVVGSGPNGLMGALVLAEAGCRVLVLEAADRVGGALRTDELTLPGFRHDVGATVLPLAMASPAFRGRDLPGLQWAHPPVPAGHPLDDGAVLVHRDVATTADALGADAKVWRRTVGKAAAAGDRLVDALLSPLSPSAAVHALGPLARYGATGIMPATVLGRSAFRTERGRAVLAGMSAHSVLSLRRPITAGYGVFMSALAHHAGWPLVRGGSERLAEAIAARLSELGAEIRTGHRVGDLRDLPPTAITLLDLTPRQVLDVAGEQLPSGYRRGLRRFRYGPGVFKLDYALDAPVPWRAAELAEAGTVHLGGSMAEIAAAEAEVGRGRHPDRPYVLCVQPTVADPSRAPAGKHVLWAYCHVPNGSAQDCTASIEAQLERFAPGFSDRVLSRHALTTADLQRMDANLVGGDIGGGAADLSQFVARPVLRAHPWATPVPGLYLCSASTPPGGGVHGMGGWHAAHLALRRYQSRRDHQRGDHQGRDQPRASRRTRGDRSSLFT